MFSISLLNADQQGYLSHLLQTNQTRSHLTALAIGRALGQAATVPSEPVESPDVFFGERNAQSTVSLLDMLNELCPIDHELALEYACKFFRLRYDIIHGSAEPAGSPFGVPSFFRLGKHFSEESLRLIQDEHAELGQRTRAFIAIVAALRQVQSV